MEKKITCIICPRGCAMTAKEENGKIVVTGPLRAPDGQFQFVPELAAAHFHKVSVENDRNHHEAQQQHRQRRTQNGAEYFGGHPLASSR